MERHILFGLKEHEAACSNWLMLFFVDILFHWLGIIGFTAKIVTNNGRTLYKLYIAPRIDVLQKLEINLVKVFTIPVENDGLPIEPRREMDRSCPL